MMAVRLRHTSRTTFSGLTACRAPNHRSWTQGSLVDLLHGVNVLLQHILSITVSDLEHPKQVVYSASMKDSVDPRQWADMCCEVC